MAEPLHCSNYDPGYPGCRECPGKVEVTQPDGTKDTLCRAGEGFIRTLIASSEEIPTLADVMPQLLSEIEVRRLRHENTVKLRMMFD